MAKTNETGAIVLSFYNINGVVKSITTEFLTMKRRKAVVSILIKLTFCIEMKPFVKAILIVD